MSVESCNYSAVVWEWLHDSGHWLPYTPDVTLLLDRSNSKNLISVCLGDADPKLSNYSANLKDMVQISESTDWRRPIRKQIYSCQSPAAWGVTWQWSGDDHNEWLQYSMEVACVLEDGYRNGLTEINLSNYFAQMNYTVDLVKMIQIKNSTGYQRSIKRLNTKPYVMIKMGKSEKSSEFSSGQHICPMSKSNSLKDNAKSDPVLSAAVNISSFKKVSDSDNHIEETLDKNTVAGPSSSANSIKHSSKKLKKSSGDKASDDSKLSSTGQMIMKALSAPAKAVMQHFSNSSSTSNIKIAHLSSTSSDRTYLPVYVSTSCLKPVPGVDSPSTVNKRMKHRNFEEEWELVSGEKIIEDYSKICSNIVTEEPCCICCESLQGNSGYGDDNTVIELKNCQHIFHKLCLLEMHQSSNQANYIQCPTCKSIHGVKTGNQPFGKIDYHIIPYSLPTFTCNTIRIIYDIPCGIQTYEHPNPGKRYSARSFPRVCYLPDIDVGRKVLKLLIKAWERRLTFTIGNSVTTGETDTVTWNEIHHKTEFGSNYSGHGYPDENYFDNILLELSTQGIVDEDDQ